MSRKKRQEGGVADYRGEHGAPDRESGAPLHDVTANGVYPPDVYGRNGRAYYGDGSPHDAKTFGLVHEYRGHPNKPISIYRAVPKTLTEANRLRALPPEESPPKPAINPGDWVTINRDYAKDHGESALNGQYRILSKSVKARDIYTNGDSMHEWGYDPQPHTPPPSPQAGIIGSTPDQSGNGGISSGGASVDAALGIARATGGGIADVRAMMSVRKHRQDGGVTENISDITPRFHIGPIHAAVGGRTDHLPMTVESGSYVIPADVVSAGGEGNTLAGFKVLRRTFGGEPYGGTAPYGQTGGVYGLPVSYAKGGRVKAAGVMFLSPDRKVLLMRRIGKDHAGEWAFPAGHIEKGERPETAARREAQEETGHEHEGGLSPLMHSDIEHVSFTTYLAHAPGEFKPVLNDEHDRAEWVGLDEAEKLPLHPGVRAALAKLKARAHKAAGGGASGVPIVAAGGEWVISPRQVRRVGDGDIDVGHRVLDGFVKTVRKELIGTLQKLPGPQRD